MGECKIAIIVQYEILFPILFDTAKILEKCGAEIIFAAFTLREHILVKKNCGNPFPKNVFSIFKQTVEDEIISQAQLDEMVDIALLKYKISKSFLADRILKIASYLSGLFDTERPIAVFVWNGEDVVSMAAVAIAKKKGITVVFGENGYFDNTLQIDIAGVNAKNSLNRKNLSNMTEAGFATVKPGPIPEDFYLSEINGLNILDRAYCFIARKIIMNYYRIFPELKGKSWFGDFVVRIKRFFIKKDSLVLPDKFIFIPLQVHDDTQVLLNSRFFKDMESFVDFCCKATKNKFSGRYRIVVKEHPEDLGRKSYEIFKKTHNDIIWLKKYSLDLLLDNAAMVFVLNSSVGLQAIERHKPVIVFGESFYALNEICFKVDGLKDVDSIFVKAAAGLTEQQITDIDRYVRFLKEDYFIGGGWKRYSIRTVYTLAYRIMHLAGGSRYAKV